MDKSKTPKIGHSVFIGFVTDGEGQKVKGASLIPCDKVTQVYDHRETGNNGEPVYQVQVASGDVVLVVDKDNVWHAVN